MWEHTDSQVFKSQPGIGGDGIRRGWVVPGNKEGELGRDDGFMALLRGRGRQGHCIRIKQCSTQPYALFSHDHAITVSPRGTRDVKNCTGLVNLFRASSGTPPFLKRICQTKKGKFSTKFDFLKELIVFWTFILYRNTSK